METDADADVVLGAGLARRGVGVDTASAPRHERGRWRWLRRRWPRLLGGAVLAVLTLLVVDSLGGGLVYRARQGQLIADFRTPRKFTATGRALAVLQIPKLGTNVVVVEGVGPPQLRGAPGHLPTSAVPGTPGNAVVMGHHRRFGGPFDALATLVEGDEIYVQPKGTQDVVVYRVSAVTRGGDELVPKLAPTDDIRLTLVTSTSRWIGSSRVVVEATATTSARRPPPASKAPLAPSSLEPAGGPVNASIVLAIGWLALGVVMRRALSASYPRTVRWLAAAAPFALGATLLWLEIDRWLAATL